MSSVSAASGMAGFSASHFNYGITILAAGTTDGTVSFVVGGTTYTMGTIDVSTYATASQQRQRIIELLRADTNFSSKYDVKIKTNSDDSLFFTEKLVFHVGSGTAAEDSISVFLYSVETLSLGADRNNFRTSALLNSASETSDTVTIMDNAIASLNKSRAALGAAFNRLDYTVSNLTNINTNLSAARGRILDADYAAETTKLAKQQIIQQAALAMLAQANASKQYVLILLQG